MADSRRFLERDLSWATSISGHQGRSSAHSGRRSLDHDGPSVDNPHKGKKSKAMAKPAASQPRRGPPLPTGLKGCSVLPGGGSICFGYNLMTCKVTGKGCPKGRHPCTWCFQDHPYGQCPTKDMAPVEQIAARPSELLGGWPVETNE
eukprot:1682015-Amphidinium_carterae.1